MTTPSLNDLNDIVAAPAASWWPLAPGWYVLALVSIALITLIAVAVRRYTRRRRARRAAINALHDAMTLSDINLLLKRACYAYYPEPIVAHLSGKAWHDFLLAQLSANAGDDYAQLLTEVARYNFAPRPAPSELTADYLAFARYWLRHALPPKHDAAVVGGEQ
ncbi:DUF4381 domain-containing protein [Pseudidiomarina sediminum]|uniref:DUF4381 domain-containing protein n=1 Tax=Pseudidiomarina sediminum TaxID=431675 RepID=UPI001C95A9C5|nr:DUF4381 domain-containing protein [Pseudidiomarina sediminum]MBY6063478.1 DUF4381 domain-containing protein [Pseudidiomarina sediminum]